MPSKRERQEQSLRKLIREACMENEVSMPCPISTANELKSSGASASEVMEWVSQLIDAYHESPESESMIHNPLSMVAVERYQRKNNRLQNNQKTNEKSLRLGSTFTGYGFG